MKEKLKAARLKIQPLMKHPMIQCGLLALILDFFIEIMSRCSIFKAFAYIFTSPLIFLYNGLIIMSFLSLAVFFRRKTFAFSILSLPWIIIGITDFVLLRFRVTPFTGTDITLIKSALDIWQYYLKLYHLILIGIGIILLILGYIILFKKSKKFERTISFTKLILFCVITICSTFAFTEIGIKSKLLATNFGNISDAYHTYGLPYCFINSLINTGVDKPDIYSTEVVGTIVDAVEQGKVVTSSEIVNSEKVTAAPTITEIPTQTPTEAPMPTPTQIPTIVPSPAPSVTTACEETPNIIMLQLESFFDPTRIIGVEFNEDPIPNFHALKEQFSSGFLSVPSVGAGTANTEFEIMTGMNLDFFGPGEYPYKTILQKKTCESIGYNLKNLGYSTHALHNNTGTFYDRYLVFSRLGYDTFTSIEYMQNIERTPLNWAKDFVLTPEINKILDSTESQDFIYAISVQGHGSYPNTEVLTDPEITLSLSEEAPNDLYYPLLYYANQIHEMDQFVKELTDELSKRDEKTIVVMYGDHLPTFPIDESNLTNENLFNTEYIIWSNFDMEVVDDDVEAYQLSATLLNRLNIHEGLITKLHQTQRDSDIYLDELQVLVYDMLYGNMDCFNGENPYAQTDLQMGTVPIIVSHVDYVASTTENENGLLVINGSNFTPYSKIYVNDEHCSTIFVNDMILVSTVPTINPLDKINVIQSGNDMHELSRTSDYFYEESSSDGVADTLGNLTTKKHKTE